MLRKRSGLLVAIAAAGAVLLTACSPSNVSQAGTTATSDLLRGLSFVSGTALEHHAPAHTGDFALQAGRPSTPAAQKWVQLSAAKSGSLDPVVVNGQGFTLYRFDKDTTNPPGSTCQGNCAVTWPPVVIAPHGKVFVQGVDPSTVGIVNRPDGTHQLTIAGHPVYRFSKDLQPGETNGQGVAGTWFGVRPDGGKAVEAPAVAVGRAPSARPSAAPATATYDFRAGFSDGAGSQRVGGDAGSCQHVTAAPDGSLDFVSGTLTLHSGAGCSGASWVVDGNVSDLAAIGFAGRFASVYVGDDDTTRPAADAVLDDDADFAGSGSQGVSGPVGSCQNLSHPAVVSSVQAEGRLTLWSGHGCTGRSVVIDGKVSRLAALGFDNKTAAVSFS
ncbi:hypothetical protein [Streptantibioticus silvisoli]|uniref:Lipoprotein n=1 Tax=Streptantibioticus silvisoli TaxID=2705255 RepID=A0ABT6VUM8_9ACTN|nr:hypothetical protein [Streptantibioticus silvisoli]MDI5962189.1 hypothetical protein [Streptantibioticus silvisoli]